MSHIDARRYMDLGCCCGGGSWGGEMLLLRSSTVEIRVSSMIVREMKVNEMSFMIMRERWKWFRDYVEIERGPEIEGERNFCIEYIKWKQHHLSKNVSGLSGKKLKNDNMCNPFEGKWYFKRNNVQRQFHDTRGMYATHPWFHDFNFLSPPPMISAQHYFLIGQFLFQDTSSRYQ